MNKQKTILKAILPEHNLIVELIRELPAEASSEPIYIVTLFSNIRKGRASMRYSNLETAIEKFDEILADYIKK